MEQSVESGVRQEPGTDRVRDFLVNKGKLPSDYAGERDERVFNAAMSCIDLSMRPYERRLLSRAVHDADRLDALLNGRPAATSGEPAALFSPAEYREFVTLVERDVQQPGPEGPVPTLFRNGAMLVAASYLWDNDDHVGLFNRTLLDLRASLRLLDDLLNWIESGKRGDRIETLQEAQSRMEALETESRSQHAEILQELRGIAQSLGTLQAGGGGEDPVQQEVQNLGGQLQALHGDVRQLAQSNAADSAIQEVARDLEARISGLSDVTTKVVQGQQEIVRMLLDSESAIVVDEAEEVESAVEQLRSLMLIGLVGIAVIAILVIVSITTG